MAGMLRPPCDEGVIRGTAAAAPCARGAAPWILAASILGAGMVFVDGTVVTVMLPTLQGELGAGVGDAQRVVAAYALGLAALSLVGGALGDHLGRRRVYGSGLVLFAAASVWCALAPTVGQLVAARAAQGIGGALVLPGSLALIGASFGGARRGVAIGTWASFATVSAGLGPVLGGVLVQYASWRWVFALNLPVAALALWLLRRWVPESRDPGAGRLDGWGAGLATGGLAALVSGLIASGRRGFGDGVVLAALALGAVLLAGFVAVEDRSRAPMLPLELFRSRTFSGATLLTLALYAAGIGGTFFLPFNLIQVQGYSATAAGAAQIPFVLITFGLSRWSGGLVARVGARLPLTVGPLLVAAGFALFARPGIGGSYWATFFPAIVVLGIGMAITVAPLTTAVMGAVEDRHAGLASGINNAVSRTAGLLAIAVFGIVVANAFGAGLDDRLDDLDLPPEARTALDGQRDRLAGAEVPAELEEGTRTAAARAVDEAFLGGFRLTMLLGAAMALASAAIAVLFIEGKAPREATAPGGGRAVAAAAADGD